MPTQNGTITVKVESVLSSSLDLSVARDWLVFEEVISLSSGTGAGAADQVWHDQRTLNASASEELDLAGSLTNALGQTVTFARIKVVIVRAASGNTNNVILGGASSNGWTGPFGGATHTLAVRPGWTLALAGSDATALTVTAGTGDLLKVANSGGSTSVTYDIVIIGATA